MASETPSQYAVFEHQKRREWGLGVLAWESKDRRGYVFENGQTRVLAEPFYSLMRRVDRPLEEVRALFECLKPELDAARAEQGSSLHTPKSSASTMTFEEQLSVFHAEFPEGFSDPAWLEQQRGLNAKKRVGAHRNSAIQDARTRLGLDAFKARIAAQEFAELHADICSVLRATDLVPSGELALLSTTDAGVQRTLGLMFFELLHGKGAFGPRFDQFLVAFQQTVKKPAGWQLVTTLPALLDPEENISVRPAAFRAQAKLMSRKLLIPKIPSASSYQRCLAVAKLASAKLTERSQTPCDMLDVLDFIRVTTRPAARQRLADLKKAMP
jgi:hypothetical protein